MQRTRGRHQLPALSLDPPRLADLALRMVQGPASPETSRLLLSSHIDGRTLSTYIEDVESIASAVSDEGLRGQVTDALRRVSDHILPPPGTIRTSSTLSLTELAERLQQRQETRVETPRPSCPPLELDETIPEWDFDDTPPEATSGATRSDGGVMQAEAPPSPASTYFSLDLYGENLLMSPTSMRDTLELETSDREETPTASPAVANENLRSGGTTEADIATGTPGEDLVTLLRVSDRILLASSIAMLQHIARLDAMAVQPATPSHASHSCHCERHVYQACPATEANGAHQHVQAPFAMQEVHDWRPEPPLRQDAPEPPVKPAPERPATTLESITVPEDQEEQPSAQEVPPEILQTHEASGTQVDATTQPSPQRDFVRILQPSVYVTRPRYRDVEVQAGDGEVVATEPEDGQARYPSFVLL